MVTAIHPISFCRLSNMRCESSEAMVVFGTSEKGDKNISGVLEKGLQAGSVDVLRAHIDSLFKSGYYTNPARTLSNIANFFARSRSRELLFDLLKNDQAALDKIKKVSYQHDNGFRKIVLLSSPNFKLRLHVFEQNGLIIPQENIHDHRWPFASVCLHSELFCQIFEEVGVGQEPLHHYKYSPVGSGDKQSYSVDGVGHGFLNETGYLSIGQKMGYYLPESSMHRVINRSGVRVVTLVVTGPAVKSTCNLFSKDEFKQEVVPVERFNEYDIFGALHEFKSL